MGGLINFFAVLGSCSRYSSILQGYLFIQIYIVKQYLAFQMNLMEIFSLNRDYDFIPQKKYMILSIDF